MVRKEKAYEIRQIPTISPIYLITQIQYLPQRNRKQSTFKKHMNHLFSILFEDMDKLPSITIA